jgi:hypothetical protein
MKLKNQRPGPKVAVEPVKKNLKDIANYMYTIFRIKVSEFRPKIAFMWFYNYENK